MSSNKKGGDERFLRVQKDPRFWEMPERERKIDKRFQSMFHDKRFTEKYTVNKRGRPINQTSTEDLKHFYNVSSSEDEDDDEEGVKSKKKKEVKEELVKVEIEVKVEKEVKVEIEVKEELVKVEIEVKVEKEVKVKVEKEVKESKDVKAEGPPSERGVRVIEEDELVRYTAAEKTFAVRKGLPVYLLAASICQGVEEQIPHLTAAYVHPDTFLARSLEQHAWKFDRVTGEALVVVHIGTDDVASGLSPAAIVGQMEALIDRIQHGHAEPLYVAVCSILPRLVDNQRTMGTVRDTNRRFHELCRRKKDTIHLPTGKLFLHHRQIIQNYFTGDGVHLNVEGKKVLFNYLKTFLWHFCKHS
ncbi:uncharacterized protein LOC117533556 isoform X11 [Gymnodraco acuticeps]|uniref:1-alkyl-2-acetylglycerophosphocholine esterase n=1 Tax=Gymnodraco acuticeps TaxID=8218 RepID=A0A6P8SRD9_GYMAC|nr:uncharacterized protein LOC117533556 isoform X10 [Gymnodraco acuticeps]XP_034053259.1 uncharacterized protein LOC117533556 isoform X11 [Gymnodraco acuticeps]